MQVRGRALRTLGDTLAPKADAPVALELHWLVVSPSVVLWWWALLGARWDVARFERHRQMRGFVSSGTVDLPR